MILLDKIQQCVACNDINSDAFNDAIADIQKILGVVSGDYAGLFFSDYSGDNWPCLMPYDRRAIIVDYITHELKTFY